MCGIAVVFVVEVELVYTVEQTVRGEIELMLFGLVAVLEAFDELFVRAVLVEFVNAAT